MKTQVNSTNTFQSSLVEEQKKSTDLQKALDAEKTKEAAKETETNFVLTSTLDSLKQYKKQEEIKDQELQTLEQAD